jgi:AbrB family looped-hinge helix DNA binding protein
MTHRVGAKGQVVIPKGIRDEIGIKPGDEVTFGVAGTEVRVRRVLDDPEQRGRAVQALRGAWKDAPGATVEDLLEERRREREREDRRVEEQGG